MIGGMVVNFAQGKATSMGTDALTSTAAIPAADGPKAPAPSNAMGQTPEEAAAAAAKELARREDLKQRRVQIMKDHAENERSPMTPEERIQSANELYEKLLAADENRDVGLLQEQVLDIREHGPATLKAVTNSPSVTLVSRFLDGVVVGRGFGPLVSGAMFDVHDVLKRSGVWDFVNWWKGASQSEWDELQRWYAQHGIDSRENPKLPSVNDYRK